MTQKEFQEQFGGKIKGKWLVFGGYLDCDNNQLKSLPDNLKVGGSLYCSYNQLKSLPDNLKVGGNLSCHNNQLKALPDNLKVGGSLYCYNNQLKSLPDNLKVGGDLYCYNNQLKALPDNLKVGGDLDCSYNQLKSVPEYIEGIEDCYIFEGLSWNDPVWINRILKDELSAEEVFAIDNSEHRRVAYEYMDKAKMKALKNYKILDEQIDGKGKPMKIISFSVPNVKEPLVFYNCFDSSTDREYFLQMDGYKKCWKAKFGMFGLKENEVELVNEW